MTIKITHPGLNRSRTDLLWALYRLGRFNFEHPVFDGISSGDHAYFVHSYHLKPTNPAHLMATVNYGGPVTAMVARDNMVGTQFHPEKSQKTGLRLIANFLHWKP